MDEKNTTDSNLRGEDVQSLRQILEHRFPPPKTDRAESLRASRLSLLDREPAPWWWSRSADAQPCGQSRVLDSHHLLSTEMLARSLALSAQRARARVHGFVQSMAEQRGQEYDEMLDAWDGFGLDFMPRIPKQTGNPPDATYFYKAKIEKDIQNIHIVLQYFAVLIEEILRDQEIFKCSTKTKWEEMAEILKQRVRGGGGRAARVAAARLGVRAGALRLQLLQLRPAGAPRVAQLGEPRRFRLAGHPALRHGGSRPWPPRRRRLPLRPASRPPGHALQLAGDRFLPASLFGPLLPAARARVQARSRVP